VLLDLDGDNRNELVVATSDGIVHALRPNGSELAGWPVHTDPLPLHLRERTYGRGGVGTRHYGAVLRALAAGDLFGDGRLEIVADDNQGNVYAWDERGRLVFHRQSNPRYSGAPLTPFHTVRRGVRDRAERGFLSSPVLASLGAAAGRGLDVIVAREDRHVYAWHANGRAVPGFPVLVADPDKVASVDPRTHHLTFRRVDPDPGLSEDQGKIIDTPAVATIGGRQVIVVGTNEEYGAGTGDEGATNISPANALLSSPFARAGLLKLANGRVYAIRADRARRGRPFLPGWPAKVGMVDAGLLPDVGEGVNGSPVVARLRCPSGGYGTKIAVTPDAGPAYVFNSDGSSCYGKTAGADNTLASAFAPTRGRYDTPAYAALGHPAFGTLDGRSVSLLAPASGLLRALDASAAEYQGGQDLLSAWDPARRGGPVRPGFPAQVNDLQSLTGPAVGQVTARRAQQVLAASASLDLEAFSSCGAVASSAWPKLTGDWSVATPTLGSFGTLDTALDARKDVVSVTRAGTLSAYRTAAPACSPSSSPRFHHDIANSGDYERDAVPPGVPMHGRLRGRVLSFVAPGGDLLCGRAQAYQLVTSARPITAEQFGRLERLPVRLAPASAGRSQRLRLPRSPRRYVAIRAVDQAGNLGRPLVLRVAG
jgi:hypothetical protein